MIRKLAVLLAVLMMVFLAWAVVSGDAVSVTINGREVSGPFGTLVGVWGAILAAVILFCVAILLAFVFAGVGLIVLGVFVLVGLVLAAIALPFLLPVLIPLFLVWLLCYIARRKKAV
ncbi:MAG TPA: hypothetical protein VMW16_03935 [Sedimentisphaerales bacterium]|nr:hypothetical protein [Sedimentisphaerales bacterium]